MKDFDLSQFHQAFFDEAQEHLDEMERLLLAVDLANPDADDLNAIFRAAHSIKGGSATFGFADMAELTHVLESLLDLVRNGKMVLSNDIVEASLHAGDVIREQLRGHHEGVDVPPDEALATKQILSGLLGLHSEDTCVASREKETDCAGGWRIWLQADGIASELVRALRGELGRMGELSGPPEEGEAGAKELVFELRCESGRDEVEEILSFIAHQEQYRIEPLIIEKDTGDHGQLPKCEVESEGDGYGFFTDPGVLPVVVNEESQGYGFFADFEPGSPSSGGANDNKSASPLNPVVQTNKEVPARRVSDKENETSIRVSIDKVDQLINLVGELVITQAMLAQTVSGFDPILHENLFNGMGQLERNSRNLQEAVMSIRMLPMSFVFSRFPRVVRDVASKLGKQVELKLVGEHTELDKGLIEKLSDPLTHLVRNSLDHGIELPEQRVAAGKPAKGSLTLQASQQGGNIVVEVIDDGAGLNRERILAKAHERGIAISPEAPDHEVWPLIFAPGFSTAEKITDVSGRGVGMDVVKRNIEGMGGRVEIDSSPGTGTLIRIRLPLTLAILDGMYIGVGRQVFILPLNLIVESLQPQASEISTVAGQERVVHVRGEYLPLLCLHEIFKISPQTTDPTQGIVVIIELEGEKTALFVDQLLGQHQVVIKSLETNYRKVPGVSGATIMGDGRVALILDVPSLVQLGRK